VKGAGAGVGLGSREPRGDDTPRLTVLAGGVGAARFLRGLVEAAPEAQVTVIGNTGDDFLVHSLHVSPDLDSVTYALSGEADELRGWGMRDESWRTLGRLAELGETSWFQVGDRDLATHLFRTERLMRGRPLSEVTAELAGRMGLTVGLIPMSDQAVVTRIHTKDGRDLHIQEYLVREGCAPEIASFEFRGAERARPAPGVLEAIADADLVIIAPSNPVISIGPILAVPGIRQAVGAATQVVAVSPIVGGRAIKGPAVAMLEALGVAASPVGVAQYFAGLIGALVMDREDAALAEDVLREGAVPVVCDTMMVSPGARLSLAADVLSACCIGTAVGGDEA